MAKWGLLHFLADPKPHVSWLTPSHSPDLTPWFQKANEVPTGEKAALGLGV